MPNKPTIFGREPALFAGLFSAALVVAVELGADIDSRLQAALMALLIAVMSFVVRQKVEPFGPESGVKADDDYPFRDDEWDSLEELEADEAPEVDEHRS